MLIFAALTAQPRTVPLNYTVASGNFIRAWNATAPEQVPNTLMTRPLRDVKQSTQYLDGLGRPLQKVVKKGSLITNGTPVDIISTSEYDAFGREPFKYLPAPSTATDVTKDDGSFKINAFTQQANFYSSTDPAKNPIANQSETYFYSQTNLEASPANRVQENFAPGDSWVGTNSQVLETNRRSIKTKYYVNTTTDGVRIWNIGNGALGTFGTTTSPGTYNAGELYKSISIDENGKQVIEFKDKDGKIVLKKVQLTATADDGTGKDHNGWLCTYFMYDDLNNLRCILQPVGVTLLSSWVLNNGVILAEQCFRYAQDSRNRMIMKQVPGAGTVYMVYDMYDRLVMTQDALMRATNQWLVTKYDEQNRPIETGLWTNATAITSHWTTASASSTYPTTSTGYEQLSITHYDDYTGVPGGLTSTFDNSWVSHFIATYNASPDYAQQQTASLQTKGMITWSQVKVLGTTTTFLYTVNIYDEKGRILQVKSKNNTTGTDVLTTQYNWAGQHLLKILKQEKAGSPTQTSVIVTKMTYDDLGRLVKTEKKLSNTLVNTGNMSAYKTISEIEYDALGQLKKKKLGTKPVGGTELAKIDFDYNIRGWLLSINKGYMGNTNADQYFSMELGYDKNASLGSFSPKYNGNIAGTIWKSEGDQQKRKYDFTYDELNRITAADFNQYVSGSGAGANFDKSALVDFSVSGITYDGNGNILGMTQKGLKLSSSPVIDQMTYAYQTYSNKLKTVTESASIASTDNKLGDFTDRNRTGDDYGYDVNGNLTLDKNKAITGITYNHLNLPLVITITGKGTITYTYDAAGTKLKKVTSDISTAGKTITTTTTYLGSMVYESKATSPANTPNDDYVDQLQFIAHEEGRIRFVKATTSTCTSMPDRFIFDYFIKDHQGNTRTVLTEQKEDICYIPATVEDASFTNEQKIYDIIDARRILKTTVGAPQASFQNKLYQTHGNIAGQKTGLGVTLKVMAGDKIKIFAESYYTLPAGGNPGGPLNMAVSDLLTTFAGSGAVSSVKGTVTATDVQNLGTNNTQIGSFITRTPGAYTAKAYLNWILFDDQLKYVNSGAEAVGSGTSTGGGVYTQHITFTNAPVNITKSGFFYVFVSNENNLAVFFDNLVLTHSPGPILEETHYYPFGLTMSGISSRTLTFGSIQNKYKFNGANELQANEFSDNSGLELFDAVNRLYDPQIGRFWQIDELSESNWEWSPYEFALNNPILFNDPLGLDPETSTPDKPKELAEVVVMAIPKGQWAKQRLYYAIINQLNRRGASIDDILQPSLREMMYNYDAITKHRERVAEMTRASDKIFLEFSSWFIPVGQLTKLRYLKYAAGLFKSKRAGVVTKKVVSSLLARNTLKEAAIGGGSDLASQIINNSIEYANSEDPNKGSYFGYLKSNWNWAATLANTGLNNPVTTSLISTVGEGDIRSLPGNFLGDLIGSTPLPKGMSTGFKDGASTTLNLFGNQLGITVNKIIEATND